MTLGPDHNRQRSYSHDYRSACIYLLTLTVEGRKPLLGHLVGNEKNTHIELTPLGEAVRYELHALCQRHPQLRLLQYQVMPDHVHVILQVTDRLTKPIGSLLSSWKIACGHAYARLCPAAGQWAATHQQPAADNQPLADSQPQAGASAIPRDEGNRASGRGAFSTRTAAQAPQPAAQSPAPSSRAAAPSPQPAAQGPAPLFCSAAQAPQPVGPEPAPSSRVAALAPQVQPPQASAPFRRLFSEGYNDRILQGPGQLRRMIDYVRDNPRRLFLKRAQSPYFTLRRCINIAGHTLDAIGNLSLLDQPMLAVHCRRHWSKAEHEAFAARCLKQAKHGSVLIGAFISPSEKAIALQASEHKLPLIHLMENGFPDLYKPTGRAFYACAEGRLLQLAPWPHHPARRVISREQCNALNTIAESIALQHTR